MFQSLAEKDLLGLAGGGADLDAGLVHVSRFVKPAVCRY